MICRVVSRIFTSKHNLWSTSSSWNIWMCILMLMIWWNTLGRVSRDFCGNPAAHFLQMKIVVKKLLEQELVVGAPSREFDTQAKQELSWYALKMAAVSEWCRNKPSKKWRQRRSPVPWSKIPPRCISGSFWRYKNASTDSFSESKLYSLNPTSWRVQIRNNTYVQHADTGCYQF